MLDNTANWSVDTDADMQRPNANVKAVSNKEEGTKMGAQKCASTS